MLRDRKKNNSKRLFLPKAAEQSFAKYPNKWLTLSTFYLLDFCPGKYVSVTKCGEFISSVVSGFFFFLCVCELSGVFLRFKFLRGQPPVGLDTSSMACDIETGNVDESGPAHMDAA